MCLQVLDMIPGILQSICTLDLLLVQLHVYSKLILHTINHTRFYIHRLSNSPKKKKYALKFGYHSKCYWLIFKVTVALILFKQVWTIYHITDYSVFEKKIYSLNTTFFFWMLYLANSSLISISLNYFAPMKKKTWVFACTYGN